MALWGYIRNANCCCYCEIILISQMQPTNCCCYSKIVPKMHTTNWCCCCKTISKMLIANCYFYKVLLSLQSVVEFACWNCSWNSKKSFELQCHLNSIPCFPSVQSTKEQRLLQCSNIFSIYIFNSFNTIFWLFWF